MILLKQRYIVIDHNEERSTGKTIVLYSCYDITIAKIAYNKAMKELYGEDSFLAFEVDLSKQEYERIQSDIVLNVKRDKPGCTQGIKVKSKKTSSKYVGVSLKVEKGRRPVFVASIRYKGKSFFLGHFPNSPEGEVLAAAAYNAAAIYLYGEQAVLNPVDRSLAPKINYDRLKL